ncbi:OmpH family outer membrane protein [Spongiibacter sp. KMU-166]|uniref:OmpH family outer membrane protein n=1 Tax=Spongiibacter thalassae TaxID=2721624 RepID=A0ABX1GEI1_9GAMM|nr:OmpH family outer membrane protein [Spongiibacter thalassae]NKI17600.1 OmpH family outer membrane protein [Spongiibacter thalassae]
MKAFKLLVMVVAMVWGSTALAEGRIAVFDIEAAVLNTDLAKSRLNALKNQREFKDNLAELERVRKDYEKLVEQFQKDIEILSAEQRQLAKNKIDSKRADGEHLARKIEGAQQQEVQSIMQEIGPKLQKLLPQIVKEENIGLLLPAKAVMHADASYNITAKVADKLNQAK